MRLGWLSGTVLAAMALAGAAAAEPSPANLALAQRYARAIHMENILGSMMNNLMPLLIDRAAAARGTTVTAALKDAMARAAEKSARRMAPRMLDVMTPVLADSFSEEELRAAVAYYESPPAQSLLAKMPAYTAAVTPKLGALLPALEADLEAAFCEEIGCETVKRAPATTSSP